MRNEKIDISRPTCEERKNILFDIESDWRTEWWGMPEFEMEDARPQYQITMNFMSFEDVKEFAKRAGVSVTKKSFSCWYPPQQRITGEFVYGGELVKNKYPICIPSKGRYDCQTTGKVLDEMGVKYKFFVEETEADSYIQHLGEKRVVIMPFHDLGKGSIPARNFIWEWAKSKGFDRHWVVDDNIRRFTRCNKNRRICMKTGSFFRAMEDFADRYENVALIGPHNQGFCPDRSPNLAAYLLNSRIYSCILIDTNIPYRWRGKYNEDTDLSLRVLKDGYCTVLFRSLLMDKGDTVGTKRSKPLKGGNTDNVYNTGDHRRKFAESLQKQHPDCVKVVWRFNRWHHSVDYSSFRKNKLKLKKDIVPTSALNEYGMELKRIKAKKNIEEK